jgi:Ca2+-binding EF-hand superfamily protein
MSFQAFTDVMDNKLSITEKAKMQAYFRAFDAQQKSYLTYSDYLIGLFSCSIIYQE